MINFSEATAIALHSMIYIANRKDDIISMKEISTMFKISDNHLSKVLQRLVKADYLTSTKGPKGGFQIVNGKENASYLEIYEVIEGKMCEKNCLFANKVSDCSNCIMGDLITSINTEFKNYMQSHKINGFKL